MHADLMSLTGLLVWMMTKIATNTEAAEDRCWVEAHTHKVGNEKKRSGGFKLLKTVASCRDLALADR